MPAPASEPRLGRVLGLVLLLSLGLFASWQLFVDRPPEVVAAEPSNRAASPPLERPAERPDAEELEPEPEPEPPPPKDLTLGGTLPALSAQPRLELAEPIGVAAATPDNSASPAPRASAARGAPSAAEIEAALRSVPIVMYSTAWCSVCDQARVFFGNHGLAFREIDIERDPAARAKVQAATGKTAVPVLEIDGVIRSSGFSEASTAQAIAASVERRLGVSGIQVRSARP